MDSTPSVLQAELNSDSGAELTAGAASAPQAGGVRRAMLDPRIRALLGSPALLAPLDQAVVSGTRFLTTLTLGRLCGPEVLGRYAFAFVFLILALSAEEALISRPYSVYWRKRMPAKTRFYAGNVLVHHLLLMSLVGMGFLVATGVAFILGSEFGPLLLALSFALPSLLLWEFARRYLFAHLRISTALVFDGCLSAMVLGGMLTLGLSDVLSASVAYWVLGAGGLLIGLAALVGLRKEFAVERATLRSDWRQNWTFGRWGLASQFVGTAQGHSIYWLLGLFSGAAAVGVFAACQNIILLSNPVLLGFSNLLGPRAAEAQAKGGTRAVFRTMRSATLMLIALTGAFSLAVFLWAEIGLQLLFGPGYAGYGNVVALMGLTAVGWGLHIAWGSALSALDRPQAVFHGTIAGLATTVIAGVLFIGPFGIIGAAWALVAGSFAVTAVEAWALRKIWIEDAP